MGRPRKQADVPDARKRIIEAFWTLLEQARINELTVGMISAQAHCNRGSFYYHFDDMNDLVLSAVEEELLKDSMLINDIFQLLSGTGTLTFDDLIGEQRMRRLGLAIERGGTTMVTGKIKALIQELWQAALRPDGTPLSADSRCILEYASSGVIGLLLFKLRVGEYAHVTGPSVPLMRDTSAFLLEKLSEAENIPQEDVLARLATAERISRISA